MPEQIFLEIEVRDFANLASGYRQYPDGHIPVGTTSEVNVTASHVSEGHHESERAYRAIEKNLFGHLALPTELLSSQQKG